MYVSEKEWAALEGKVDELIALAVGLREQRDELLSVVRNLNENSGSFATKEFTAAVLIRYQGE